MLQFTIFTKRPLLEVEILHPRFCPINQMVKPFATITGFVAIIYSESNAMRAAQSANCLKFFNFFGMSQQNVQIT